MTEERLEQYRALKLEIAHLEGRVDRMLSEGPQHISDSVSTSASFPYSKHKLVIRGCEDPVTYSTRLNRLQKRLDRSRAEFDELDKYIMSVPDARIRAIMQYRFIEGWEWSRIANRMGWLTESGPRLKIKKYLDANDMNDYHE
ncbi:MAG TPA: hypothetical protein DEP23_07985 [Ruminococcaceae bacterium]|nr:hypothetical protein [Oscillospiraceae bacterium]